MSETAFSGPAEPSSSDDRNLVFAVYVLMFAAVFMAGLTALVGVVLAYVRKPEADPVTRSHFAFQIRIFWVAAVLALIAGVAFMVGAGVFVTDMVTTVTNHGRWWDAWDLAALDKLPFRVSASVVVSILIGLLTGLVTGLWLIATSIYGLARHAARKPIGRV